MKLWKLRTGFAGIALDDAKLNCRWSRPNAPASTVAAAALVACVVALSRAYLQVHYPSDVVIGAAAGAAWAFGLGLLARARR